MVDKVANKLTNLTSAVLLEYKADLEKSRSKHDF